jgi:hypothetical protein
MFRQDGSCPALLEDLSVAFPYGAVTRSGPPFQTVLVTNQQATGLVRVRSPLLAESRLMSFPPATEMFQFAGFASLAYVFSQGYPLGWVAPFGDPGINDRSHLPRAFRSVPRPSSPLSAKASTRCPSRRFSRHTQRQRPQLRADLAKPSRCSNCVPAKAGTHARVPLPAFAAQTPVAVGGNMAFGETSVSPVAWWNSRSTGFPPGQTLLSRRHFARYPTAQKAATGALGLCSRKRLPRPSVIARAIAGYRYGHTTRFFTIVHQHRTRGSGEGPRGNSFSAAAFGFGASDTNSRRKLRFRLSPTNPAEPDWWR